MPLNDFRLSPLSSVSCLLVRYRNIDKARCSTRLMAVVDMSIVAGALATSLSDHVNRPSSGAQQDRP